MKHTNKKNIKTNNKLKKTKKNRNNKNTKRGGAPNNVIVNVKSLNELLNYLVEDSTTKANAISEFTKYIKIHYINILRNEERTKRYDITVLCAVMNIMFDYIDPVFYKKENNEEINANRTDIKCCNTEFNTGDNADNYTIPEGGKQLPFFMDDMYCEDLLLFSQKYDEFMKSKTSRFFYESNIANIALLFKCCYNRCFDDYILHNEKKHTKYNKKIQTGFSLFKKNKNKTKFTSGLNTIKIKFDLIKKELIIQLIKSYISCNYNDVCDLYIQYLNFYKDTFSKILNNQVDEIDSIIKTPEEINDAIIISLKDSKINTYFIFLSCNHVSEYKQSRLYMTRFIDSHIGHIGVHNNYILNTMDTIAHDFYFHGNLNRIQNTTPEANDNINKEFIINLFNMLNTTNKHNSYQLGMYIIQIIQNEKNKKDPVIFNKNSFIDYFNDYINQRWVPSHYTKEIITNFIKWFLGHTKFTFDYTKSEDNYYNKIEKFNINSMNLSVVPLPNIKSTNLQTPQTNKVRFLGNYVETNF